MTHRIAQPVRGRATRISAAIVAMTIAVSFAAISCARHPSLVAGGSSPGTTDPGGAPAGTGSPGQGPGPGTGTRSPAASPTTSPQGSAASLIPTSGAYLGAYVQPALYTPQDEIAALASFQRSVGGAIGLVHSYHPWEDPFPDSADRHYVRSGKVLLLTWSGTPDTRKIIAGDYDGVIRTRAKAIKGLGRPILMEFRHEMDRPNLQWAVHGPADYIKAWDHIRSIFTRVGADNVGWVWCPTGYGFEQGRAQPFYPGDSEVDWVCADIYSPSAGRSLQQVADPFLKWARPTHKPVLIGEFGVASSPGTLPQWLLAAGELVGLDPQIKGLAYFDANGTDSNGHPFSYWIGDNPAALRAFAQMRTWRIFHPVLPSSP